MTSRERVLAWIAGVVGLAVVGAGVAVFVRARADDTTAVTTSTTSTTAVPTATAPLTGLPLATADDRPALGVKIDLSPGVNAFDGLEQADMVYELLVEGDITRAMAIFQSHEAPNVGPVRSLRASDFQLVANLGHPIVAFSGADELTLRASKLAPFVPYDPDSSGAEDVFHRDRSRRAPHNLFLSTTAVRDNTTGAGPATAPFTFAAPSDPPPAGLPVAGVRIRFTGFADAAFTWDDARHQWLRWMNRTRQVGTDGNQLGVDTVLVLDSTYGTPPWDRNQPMLDAAGSGSGLLLSGGAATAVRWDRPDAVSPFALTDAAGAPLRLPAGRTWVAFPTAGATSTMDATAVAALPRAG